MKLLNPTDKLPLEEQQKLERKLFNENIERCKLFAKIVILFESILIVMNISSGKSLLRLDFYLIMYLVLWTASIIMLLYMRWFERNKNPNNHQLHYYQNGLLGFVVFFLLWGAVVSLADQQHYGNIMAFAVNVMCVSILFHASNRKIIQLFALPVAVFYIGLPIFQHNQEVLFGHYINFTVFLFFSWLASRMLYSSYATSFYNKLLLIESNYNLALKIEENETINRQLEKANEQLKRLTLIDELTQVPNRRGFQEYIQTTLKENVQGRTLTFMMMDIDSFKPFNDYYGHLEGDKILQTIASKINGMMDLNKSIFARFGGEEFVAAMTKLDEGASISLAKEIGLAIEGLKIPHEYSTVSNYVTISIGIATGHINNELDVEHLLAKADHALYKAKSLGGNKIETTTSIYV